MGACFSHEACSCSTSQKAVEGTRNTSCQTKSNQPSLSVTTGTSSHTITASPSIFETSETSPNTVALPSSSVIDVDFSTLEASPHWQSSSNMSILSLSTPESNPSSVSKQSPALTDLSISIVVTSSTEPIAIATPELSYPFVPGAASTSSDLSGFPKITSQPTPESSSQWSASAWVPTAVTTTATIHSNYKTIAGSVVGAFFFIVLMLLIVVALLNRRRRMRTPASQEFVGLMAGKRFLKPINSEIQALEHPRSAVVEDYTNSIATLPFNDDELLSDSSSHPELHRVGVAF